jgi:hypothetical protein
LPDRSKIRASCRALPREIKRFAVSAVQSKAAASKARVSEPFGKKKLIRRRGESNRRRVSFVFLAARRISFPERAEQLKRSFSRVLFHSSIPSC